MTNSLPGSITITFAAPMVASVTLHQSVALRFARVQRLEGSQPAPAPYDEPHRNFAQDDLGNPPPIVILFSATQGGTL
jgi:hypothetical protein